MEVQEEQHEKLLLFCGYPHSLMQHIRTLLRSENQNPDWLVTKDFFQKYCEEFFEYPQEIKELRIATEKGMISKFLEYRKGRDWERRVFIQTSLFILIADLKEYEAVELLESLMWVFGWEISVEVNRKWSVSDADRARFHSSGLDKVQRKGKKSFDAVARNYIAEHGKDNSEYVPDRAEETGQDGEERKQRKESFVRAKSIAQKKLTSVEKNIFESHEVVTEDRENSVIEENSMDTKNREHTYAVEDIVHMTESAYHKALLETKVKHENLMSLSDRKNIKKAKRGDALSQIHLAEYYEEEKTKHVDYLEAARWYSFAAHQGNFKAKFALGRLFDSGKLQKDGKAKVQAMRCFKELAEEGYPTAQSIIGMKYYLGDGVERNMAEGIKWLKKAALQGHEEAQRQLGGILADLDEKESKKWLQMADGLAKK